MIYLVLLAVVVSGLQTQEVKTALVAPTFKFCSKKNVNYGKGQFHTRDPGPQAENIGVIVTAAHAGMKFCCAERGADVDMAIGSHGHTKARATDEHTTASFGGHSLTELMGINRIVATLCVVGPVINDVVTLRCKAAGQLLFEGKTGVVGGQMDTLHDCLPLDLSGP